MRKSEIESIGQTVKKAKKSIQNRSINHSNKDLQGSYDSLERLINQTVYYHGEHVDLPAFNSIFSLLGHCIHANDKQYSKTQYEEFLDKVLGEIDVYVNGKTYESPKIACEASACMAQQVQEIADSLYNMSLDGLLPKQDSFVIKAINCASQSKLSTFDAFNYLIQIQENNISDEQWKRIEGIVYDTERFLEIAIDCREQYNEIANSNGNERG